MGQSADPEADFSIPEVVKDGRRDGFLCAAAADDAVAPMVLRGAGKRGTGEDPAQEEGPGGSSPEWNGAEEDPVSGGFARGGAGPGWTQPRRT